MNEESKLIELFKKYPGIAARIRRSFAYHYDQIQREIKAGYGRMGETEHGDFSLYSKDCWTQQRKIHHIGVCLSQWRCDEK